MLLTIDERGSKIVRTVFSIAICHQLDDNGQENYVSNDLCSTMVLTVSIAAYPVCNRCLLVSQLCNVLHLHDYSIIINGKHTF